MNSAFDALAAQQAWFWQRVTAEDAGDVSDVLLGNDRLDAGSRLEIYRDMYRVRLVDAIGLEYPALSAALGDGFRATVIAYIQAFPSASASIGHAGDRMPEFLSGWTADLARLDRARSRVFDAEDAVPVTVDDLRSLAPEAWPDLRLSRAPSTERVFAAWAVETSWDEVQAGVEVHEPAPAQYEEILVWRLGISLRVAHRRLTPNEGVLLDVFDAGGTFGDACLSVAAHGGDAAQDAAYALLGLVQAEVLRFGPP